MGFGRQVDPVPLPPGGRCYLRGRPTRDRRWTRSHNGYGRHVRRWPPDADRKRFEVLHDCGEMELTWELSHNAQYSIDDLSVFGSPPSSFESIRRRLTREQEATAGGVDYIFDIPVEVAAAVRKY